MAWRPVCVCFQESDAHFNSAESCCPEGDDRRKSVSHLIYTNNQNLNIVRGAGPVDLRPPCVSTTCFLTSHKRKLNKDKMLSSKMFAMSGAHRSRDWTKIARSESPRHCASYQEREARNGSLHLPPATPEALSPHRNMKGNGEQRIPLLSAPSHPALAADSRRCFSAGARATHAHFCHPARADSASQPRPDSCGS